MDTPDAIREAIQAELAEPDIYVWVAAPERDPFDKGNEVALRVTIGGREWAYVTTAKHVEGVPFLIACFRRAREKHLAKITAGQV